MTYKSILRFIQVVRKGRILQPQFVHQFVTNFGKVLINDEEISGIEIIIAIPTSNNINNDQWLQMREENSINKFIEAYPNLIQVVNYKKEKK